MESRRSELEQDIAELQRLCSLTSSSRVQAILAGSLHNLQEALTLEPLPQTPSEPLSDAEMHFRPIEKFAWEQQGSEVKIYITDLPDLKSHPTDKIVVRHTTETVDVQVLDVAGVNYRFSVKKLAHPVTDCKLRTTSKGFILKLKKKGSESWDSLLFKASPISKPKGGKEEEKDPGSGLMDMMREMYENVRNT